MKSEVIVSSELPVGKLNLLPVQGAGLSTHFLLPYSLHTPWADTITNIRMQDSCKARSVLLGASVLTFPSRINRGRFTPFSCDFYLLTSLVQ